MFSQATLFLFILLAIGLIAKNESLIIALVFLLVVKATGFGEKVFPILQQKGISWGVIVITIGVLAPIATGEIGFKQLGEALKSHAAWIALASGITVSLIAKGGIDLLTHDPHITTALVTGTILAVALFNGIPVGPLIGAGIAYYAMKFVQLLGS